LSEIASAFVKKGKKSPRVKRYARSALQYIPPGSEDRDPIDRNHKGTYNVKLMVPNSR
jgi:hypothetical protein